MLKNEHALPHAPQTPQILDLCCFTSRYEKAIPYGNTGRSEEPRRPELQIVGHSTTAVSPLPNTKIRHVLIASMHFPTNCTINSTCTCMYADPFVQER